MAQTIQQRLRRALGERIPTGGSDQNTFFLDAEIDDLLLESGNDFNRAALKGWQEKMAEFAKFVDVDESGSNRKLATLFKNAQAMVRHYAEVVGVDVNAAMGHGVVGRAVNLREEYEAPAVMHVSATRRFNYVEATS